MEYRAIYQEFENIVIQDRHPHAPDYMLLRLMSLVFKWLGILCFVLIPFSVLWVGYQAAYVNNKVPHHETRILPNGSVQHITRTKPIPIKWTDVAKLAGTVASGLIIQGFVLLFISQLIHAYRDIARNGFKQNALLEKLTGEPIQKQTENPAALPDLAPVPKPHSARDPRVPPPHWVPGTPRGWTVTGLDINGMQFHLSYLWVTQEQAEAYAKAEGIVTVQEIQPIRD